MEDWRRPSRLSGPVRTAVPPYRLTAFAYALPLLALPPLPRSPLRLHLGRDFTAPHPARPMFITKPFDPRTARSGSRWWGAAGSRRTTSMRSRSTPTGRSSSVSATSTPRRWPQAEARTGRARLHVARRDAGGDRRRHRHPRDAERAARRPGDPGRRGRPPRDDRKADGHALAGRQADGARLRRGGRAPVRGQAEPPQRHAAAAQAGGREEALRPDLHGEHQRLLDAARSRTTTAPPGAAPGSSTAAPS